MTTQAVSCQFMLNDGSSVNMYNASFTDGTEAELQTSGNVSAGGGVSAQSIGTFAEGKVITQVIQPVTAATKCVYAYLSRRGEILQVLPIASGVIATKPTTLNVRLQAGDTLRLLTLASAAARNCAYNVITQSGVNAIFAVTPSGAATNELTHILTGQSIGSSLMGDRIASHFCNSTDGAKYRGGSVLILNDRGLPIGSALAQSQKDLQVESNTAGTCGIGLNYEAVCITTS